MIKIIFNENNLSDKPIIVGEIDFAEKNYFCTETLLPMKRITFDLNLETIQDASAIFGDEQMKELIGEKLKKDFINNFL
jgi:hypothetical protein